MPEILDNVIPYIGGEEEKSEREPLKIWGHIEGDEIKLTDTPKITAQCLRRARIRRAYGGGVRVLRQKADQGTDLRGVEKFLPAFPSSCRLPSAPKQFLHYFEENDRPQAKPGPQYRKTAWRCAWAGWREDIVFDYKFVCLSHNTLRGAAGGAVRMAEMLCAQNYI